MMYALGTADGIVRLAGCQFSSGKQDADDELAGMTSGLHNLNGKSEKLASKPHISFPTMR